jgi:iron complex outermembrane receptor protein
VLKGLSLGYGIYYKGKFFATPDNLPEGLVPSNYTMDAAIGYNFGKLALRVNVTNLTDRISYLGAFGTWEPQWTRRVIAGVSYKF